MNRPLFSLCVALWMAVLIWGITVCYLSSLSGPKVASMLPMPLWDKLSHFAAFGVGGTLLAAALGFTFAWPAGKVALVTLLTLGLFGGVDEWHQLYTPLRSGGDMGDLLADILGAAAGALFFTLFYARRNPRPDAPASAGD